MHVMESAAFIMTRWFMLGVKERAETLRNKGPHGPATGVIAPHEPSFDTSNEVKIATSHGVAKSAKLACQSDRALRNHVGQAIDA
jgi:hypothetical protein